MKTTLSWEEFINAFNELATLEKPDPGIHRIWHHLGKGSVTTIGKYKHRLKLLQRGSVPKFSGTVPDAITTAAIDLFNELNKAVDERQTELDADIEKRYQEVEDELADLRNKNSAANKAIARLTEQLDQATTQIEHANKQNHAFELKLTKANSDIEKVTALNTQLSKATAELKEEFKERLTAEQNHTLDAKKQFTQAQDEKAAAQEKQTTQLNELKQTHRDALQSVKDEMAKLNVFYDQQIKARDAQIKALEKKCKTGDENLSKKTRELSEENNNNKDLRHQLATQSKQTDKLQDKVDSLTHALSEATGAIKELKNEKKELHAILKNIKKNNV